MINAPPAQMDDLELQRQLHSAHGPALDSTLDPNNLYVTGLDPSLTKEQLEALFSKYGRVLESKLLIDINTGMSRGAGLLRFETSQQAEAALHAMNGAHLSPSLPPIVVKYAENAAHRKAKQMMRGAARGMPSGRGGMYPPHMMGHPMGGPMGHMHPGMGGANVMGMPPGGAAAGQYYGYPMMGAMPAGVPQSMPGYPMPPQHMSPQQHHGGGGGGGGGGGSHHPSTIPVYVANLPPEADDALLWNLFGQYGQLHSVRIMKDATDPTGTRCRGIGFANFIRLEDAQNAIINLHGHPLNGKSLVVNLKLPKTN